jgi:hypothetical protein
MVVVIVIVLMMLWVMAGVGTVLAVIVRMWRRGFRVFEYAELGGRQAGSQHSFSVDVTVAHGQAAKRPPQLVEWQSGIDERAKRHVAGNAGKAIEIQHTTHS